MVNIESVTLSEFKAIANEPISSSFLEFLPDKSMYNGKGKKNIHFAILKYGGRIDSFVVLATFKVIYSSDLEIERTISKLQQFGYDLVDEDFIEKLRKPCLAMPMDIF